MKFKPFYPTPTQVKAAIDGNLSALRVVMKPQPPKGWFIMDDEKNLSEYFWTERDKDDDMMGWYPSYDNGLAPPYKTGDVFYFKEPQWSSGIRWPGTQMKKTDARLFFKVEGILPQRLHDQVIDQMPTEGYESYGACRNDWEEHHRGDMRYAFNPWTWYITGKFIPRPEGWPYE